MENFIASMFTQSGGKSAMARAKKAESRAKAKAVQGLTAWHEGRKRSEALRAKGYSASEIVSLSKKQRSKMKQNLAHARRFKSLTRQGKSLNQIESRLKKSPYKPRSPKRKSPSPKRKSPKRKSPKRKSPKRKSSKRKSPKRKSPKRKSPSPKRKSPKRKSSKRKSPKRKSPKRKSPKRKSSRR